MKTMNTEKTIFIDKDIIKIELDEINVLKENLNKVHHILTEFDINDPEAVKAPIEAVNKKLKETVNINTSFEVEPIKLSELIGKDLLYKELNQLNKIVVGSPFLDQLRWNKNSFSLKGNVMKEITKRASVIITDKKQIDLANRIESFIKEAEDIASELGVQIVPMSLVRVFPVLIYKNREVVLNHNQFLRYIKPN